MFDLEAYLAEGKRKTEKALARRWEEFLAANPQGNCPEILAQAMAYSLFSQGKRIRPVLCLAAAAAVGKETDEEELLTAACALEFIHTYSLIHDDLPCMDDDDLRRGRPTNHKVYGEAMAVLTGDGLLTQAFSLLAGDLGAARPKEALKIIGLYAEMAGPRGMVGGQAMDIQMTKGGGLQPSRDQLEKMEMLKTACLFICSLKAGGILAGASEGELAALEEFGRCFGLTFQITDDLLDGDGYAGAYGRLRALEMAGETADKAFAALEKLTGDIRPLEALTEYLVRRTE
ncbi:MAG: polyprenyl synthetase family protein [Peptococcaceae bacterium]|nr:polyprenyl synthetase family protein [Peptococcaceae bacterium]